MSQGSTYSTHILNPLCAMPGTGHHGGGGQTPDAIATPHPWPGHTYVPSVSHSDPVSCARLPGRDMWSSSDCWESLRGKKRDSEVKYKIGSKEYMRCPGWQQS